MTVVTRMIRLLLELRQQGITDAKVLSALERVPRDQFLPRAFVHQAYENVAISIGHGQTLSQPFVVARMTEALELTERLKVLEIGTGSGYHCAVIAQLCRRVYTIERHRALLQAAESRLVALRLHNITTRLGDGMLGWPEQAPFDRIIVTAAAPEAPEPILEQLSVGGILVLPIGERGRDQQLLRVRRGEDGFDSEILSTVRFVPLVPGGDHAPEKRRQLA